MQPRIKTGKSIKGTFAAVPRLTTNILRCDDSIVPDVPAAVGTILLEDIAAHVVVPVQRKLGKTRLSQETAADWDRHLITNLELGSPCFHPPVLLSARSRWHLGHSVMEVFDRAIVIDGAKRLESAFAHESVSVLPVIVLMGLDSKGELRLRRQLQSTQASAVHVKTLERIGTSTPRLMIDHQWIELEILSDPFVVVTTRGYTPAMLVRRNRAAHREHVLIGAKSLATELNELRLRRGTLRGSRISIKKQSPERTAPYVLHVEEDTGE